MSSLSQARVIKLEKIESHPNGDRLELTEVDGMTVVMQKGLHQVGNLIFYCPPDMICDPTKPPFDFLESKRIKTRKIRGIVSYGLILPIPPDTDFKEGDIVNEYLGLERYEDYMEKHAHSPGIPGFKTHTSPPPNNSVIYTDIENFKKYKNVFTEEDEVVITEKLHGCFRSDTKIRLANGEEINIEDIEKSDIIICYDENKQEFTTDIVEEVYKQELNKNWIKLFFDNNRELVCTEDHLILTENRGWVQAKDLIETDSLLN